MREEVERRWCATTGQCGASAFLTSWKTRRKSTHVTLSCFQELLTVIITMHFSLFPNNILMSIIFRNRTIFFDKRTVQSSNITKSTWQFVNDELGTERTSH